MQNYTKDILGSGKERSRVRVQRGEGATATEVSWAKDFFPSCSFLVGICTTFFDATISSIGVINFSYLNYLTYKPPVVYLSKN